MFKKIIEIFLIVVLLYSITNWFKVTYSYGFVRGFEYRDNEVVKCKECIEVSIENKIIEMASEHGVCPQTSIRIARCESNLNPFAENNHSTASGIYQFLNGTWSNYCTGNVFNYEDNIKCFMKLYPTNPDW